MYQERKIYIIFIIFILYYLLHIYIYNFYITFYILSLVSEEEKLNYSIKQREFEKNAVKLFSLRASSDSFPIEYHLELVQAAYDVSNSFLFEELSKSALLRCKYRRFEVPYINDITIFKSSSPNLNIPNGYEKIPFDLNEPDLKIQLAKLRNKNKTNSVISNPNPAIKGGNKEAIQKEALKENKDPLATEDELEKINHEYLYILLKRSIDPEGAIYNLEVALENEEGVEKADNSQNVHKVCIPITQYLGVRESTKKVPFLCFKTSKDSLKDDEEKKSLLIDLEPIVGKHPSIRPNFGFEKIDLDLRQIPKEFLRIPNNDYVFLTKK